MYSDEIDLMNRALDKAAQSLVTDFQALENLTIERKGKGDFVSQADKKSEKIIVDMLREERPDWGILGEEGTDVIGTDARYRWIIDPLDGTRNFLHNIPHWCVTIALEKDGEIVAGLTFSPMTNEKFRAIKGGGAFKNDVKIKASDCPTLDDAMIVIDTGHTCQAPEKIELFSKIAKQAGTVRIIATGALSLCYVAAGYYDAMIHNGHAMPWDLAAGFLFLQETGCTISNLELQPTNHEHGCFLAANPALHADIAKILRG